jgi:hypothetical protein
MKKLLMAAFFLISFSLFARDVEIIVEDIELNLPLEGAVIRSWDGTEYVCGEGGKAVIPAPDDRQVVIQAAYPGYETGRFVVAATGTVFTLGLQLSGVMEGRELVIETTRPGTSETRTGRSVAVSGREIAQTAEIGIIEDVMSSIKLLPGVGYAGIFNAQPSIRGGDPNDMKAALDGFYIFNPYHWGGGVSIFDPRMVQSAQLSHGVFSSRYGHTISGLLEITSKKPSPTETQFEIGANTSAANFNLSLPLMGKGGVLFMGRITFYEPFIVVAKEMAKSVTEIQPINAIRTAPFIRSGTITGNYRFTGGLELTATSFWGMDGVGVTYENSSRSEALNSDTDLIFDWTNYQGFITAALAWNPRSDMLLQVTAGTGYEESVIDGDIQYRIIEKYASNEFKTRYPDVALPEPYRFGTNALIRQSTLMFNAQGRVDFDWELKEGLLAAAGVQEMFTQLTSKGDQMLLTETRYRNLDPVSRLMLPWQIHLLSPETLDELRVSFPIEYDTDTGNNLFNTSGYGLVEFAPDSRFKTELGLQIDHYYLEGRDFSIPSNPVFNPRLSVDFNVLKSRGILQSIDLNAGTGLFSSLDNVSFAAEKEYNVTELKPGRSWTSVFGAMLEFPESLIFNIEFYYKYIFDRMYIPVATGIDSLDVQPRFDGEGRVWGIDLMLQKKQSRFWDGWLSYSFNWANYRDPSGRQSGLGFSGGNRGDDWYFPSYHRYHNLNLVLNIKPTPRINIYTRFGLASGVQLSRRIGDGPISYPVYVYETGAFIEKYYWPSEPDESNRTTPSLPMDLKFSIFGTSKTGKARYEVYFAVENVLALLYGAEGNTSFNQYTGEINTGSNAARYDIPIPIPSFGFKISY